MAGYWRRSPGFIGSLAVVLLLISCMLLGQSCRRGGKLADVLFLSNGEARAAVERRAEPAP